MNRSVDLCPDDLDYVPEARFGMMTQDPARMAGAAIRPKV
jgi:hypothetical protein